MLYKTLFLLPAFVRASHDSWSCTDARYFPQTCVARAVGNSGPHYAGVVTLGGGSLDGSPWTMPYLDPTKQWVGTPLTFAVGQPLLSCMLTQASYAIPIPAIATGNNFKFCADMDHPDFKWPYGAENGNPNMTETILAANPGGEFIADPEGETMAQKCERIGQLSLAFITQASVKGVMNVNYTDFAHDTLDTQMTTASCPRYGGPMANASAGIPGRGGDAAGFALFLAGQNASDAMYRPSADPPSADPPSANPCFPGDATVALASGATRRLDELKPGDRIKAADASGSLYYDEVSRFSYADYDKDAAFVALTTAKSALRLTAEHRVPVGESCCSNLKKAKDVAVGETLWLAAAGAAKPAVVTKVGAVAGVGVHNPLMKRGGFPVVDGVVTAFDSVGVVKLASLTVPLAEALCEATGTCAVVHEAIALANGLGPRPFIGGVVGGSGLGLVVATGLAAAAAVGGVRRASKTSSL